MTFQKSLRVVLSRSLKTMLFALLLIFPTTPLSAQSLPELDLSSFSPEAKKNLGTYIRRCEVDREVLWVTDEALTKCEFDRKCRWFNPFLAGLALGAIAVFVSNR